MILFFMFCKSEKLQTLKIEVYGEVMDKLILAVSNRLTNVVKGMIKKSPMVLSKGVKAVILGRYQGKFIPDLSYATVQDFCDSADSFPQVVRFESTLKDVQRPWAIKAILGKLPIGAKILEVGGGEPLVSGCLQELGYEVTLIDPYDGSGNGPQEYKRFKHAYPKVRILQRYFEKDCPVLTGETFDCIFSVSVLEHIPTEKLKGLFEGIAQFLKPGGYSIHSVDDVVAGSTADWHFQEVKEILALQTQLRDPTLNLQNARLNAEQQLKELYVQLQQDIETYYLSPLEFYRWKNGMIYQEYPFRKIVALQTCAMKQ